MSVMKKQPVTFSGQEDGASADVILLGVGTCGEDLALRLLGAGLSVIGVEANLVGGECPYWACLPSKMMIRAANLLQEARRVDGMAGCAQVTPDWAPVAARIRAEATGGWDDAVAVRRFESRGGRLIHGRGRLAGPRTVAVGDETLTARLGVVVATGSRPAIPPIPGLTDVDYWTTRDAIQVEDLPASLAVLGGGAVGCELAQVFARFGVAVTVVEAAPRLLPAEEPEAAHALEAAFAAEGIAVRAGAAVQRVSRRDGAIVLTLAGGDEVASEVVAERLLMAAGRVPYVKDIGLETVGLDPILPFIPVDERLRAADGLWAMGDVTGKALFTHVALYQSAIVAAGLLGESHPPARYDAVPRVTFTDPEVAAVGLTEAQSHTAGLDVVVAVKRLPYSFRGWLHASGGGVVKLVADRKTGRLVGATAAGPDAGELLGLLSLAVHARVPLADLRSMIYAFPTSHGAIGETIGAYGRGLMTVLDPEYEGHTVLDTAGAAVAATAIVDIT